MLKWLIRAVTAGCVFGLFWAVGFTLSNFVKTNSVFTVREIEVRGASHTDMFRLAKVYKPLVGQNIFANIEPDVLMTDDPWVIRLEMKRVIPNKLVVVVEEEQEILSYKKTGKCYALTVKNTEIPTNCDNVHITVAEMPLTSELGEFARLYAENEILRNNDVTLKNGFFIINTGRMIIVGTYTPGVFADNYDMFIKTISPRYKSIDHVDVTVRGKVYVKGVTNG